MRFVIMSFLLGCGFVIGSGAMQVVVENEALNLPSGHGVPQIVGFTSRGEWLIATEGRTVRIWNSNTWNELPSISTKNIIADSVLRPNSDQLIIETVDEDYDSLLEVQAVPGGGADRELRTGPWGALAVSPAGDSLLLLTRSSPKVRGSEAQFCEMIDFRSGESVLKIAAGKQERFTAAAFSAAGDEILLGTWSGRLFLYSVQGELLREFAATPGGRAHRGAVGCVEFFGGSPLVLSGDGRSEPVVKVWNRESGSLVAQLRQSDDPIDQIQGVALAENKHILAVASIRKFALYSTTTWDEIWSLKKMDREGGFNSPAFNCDEKTLVVVDYPHRTHLQPSSVRVFSVREIPGD